MVDREIKICDMCGEEDIISVNKSQCDDCLEKIRLKNKDILSI